MLISARMLEIVKHLYQYKTTTYKDMKRFRLLCLCLFCLSALSVPAQVVEKVLDIFGADSLSSQNIAAGRDSDSISI